MVQKDTERAIYEMLVYDQTRRPDECGSRKRSALIILH